MPRKVVINRRFGGFSLSSEAKKMYKELTKDITKPEHWHIDTDVARDDPHLITVVEMLGRKASSGQYANLKVITIPDGVDWVVKDYDGVEWVAEKHRTWCGSDDESNED